jgi:hypothetical protein
MRTSAGALVCDRELAIEDEAGDGELDGEGEERGRGVVDEERGGEGEAGVGGPVHSEVQL